jgi:Domain of unknown function (DUF1707)/RDD family
VSDTRPLLRIGHDERYAAITALDEHLLAGRLDHEEYGERMAAATMARTREQLEELFGDLPQPHPFPPASPSSAYSPPAWAPYHQPFGSPGHSPAHRAAGWYDPRSQLWLPDGTQLASIGRRVGAFFLAWALFVVTLGVGYVTWGLFVWARGQTPALQLLGMRAYRPATGRVAGFWWMVLRETVGRFAEGVGGIFVSLVSFLLFLTTKERRSLHDMIAGTVVLHDPNRLLPPR